MKSQPISKLSVAIGHDSGGCFLEVYTDDDDASGYGDNARIGRWYGNRVACEALNPRAVALYPASDGIGPDPFDLACERRYD